MAATEADAFLVEAVQRGEPSAWRQVIERYQGRLLSFARRMLAQPSEAEDIVQETFMGLLRSLPNYDRSRSLETYLFAILRHKLHDQFRRQPKGRRESLDALDMDEADSSWITPETPSRHLAGREMLAAQRQGLVRSLREYVEMCRRQKRFQELIIVEMLVVMGLRNKEVAAELGLTQTAVAGIKFRVIETLRKLLPPAAGSSADSSNREKTMPETPSGPTTDGYDWSENDLAQDSTVGQVWREEGVSCLKRSTLGSSLLGALDDDWNAYVEFHLNRAGCDVCRANLDDLQEEQQAATSEQRRALQERCFASSVGFLSRGAET